MAEGLALEVIKGTVLSEQERYEVVALCSRAFETNYGAFLAKFTDATHILARRKGILISHALWMPRWLQPKDLPPLRTAYVEAVATEEAYRGRGYATAVMQRLAQEIRDFELGGLSPAEQGLYLRLGWELWRGPLFIRTAGELMPTPDEVVMILRLPQTPNLDLDATLSAEWREGELW
jgi:aminoglycoside 2'-N-acetyltransferase I